MRNRGRKTILSAVEMTDYVATGYDRVIVNNLQLDQTGVLAIGQPNVGWWFPFDLFWVHGRTPAMRVAHTSRVIVQLCLFSYVNALFYHMIECVAFMINSLIEW